MVSVKAVEESVVKGYYWSEGVGRTVVAEEFWTKSTDSLYFSLCGTLLSTGSASNAKSAKERKRLT